MKAYLFFGIFILLGFSARAQYRASQLPLSLAYYGNILINPGVKIGTEWEFRQWEKTPAQNASPRQHRLSLDPQLAFFQQGGHRSNFQFHLDLAYRIQKLDRRRYATWALGLGNIQQSQVVNWSFNLSDGSRQDVERTRRHYVLPSLSYEWGFFSSPRLNWYSKFSFAPWLSAEAANTLSLQVEIGLKWHWSTSKN